MRNKAAHKCYTEDWQRTRPDAAVYLPATPCGPDGYADHVQVEFTPGGDLLAIWAQSSYEGANDGRVVFARSEDDGRTWSAAQTIDEAEAPGLSCLFGFPVMSRSGRIYCFYNKGLGFGDSYFSGPLRCKYSDDDGRTWEPSGATLQWRRTQFDHPDPKAPCTCLVWQRPIRDAKGRVIVGLTRWSSRLLYPMRHPAEGGYFYDSQVELMRFENTDEGPDPEDVTITWLPEAEGTIRVPCPVEPQRSQGYCLTEEPAIVVLPDGRLFMTMRTVTGRIWYTVSQDDGASWRPVEVLRYRDDGAEVLHPKSPCPLYGLQDGRFLLFYHNHDGTGYGARGPWDMDARRPLFMAVGEFRPDAYQPIWFSKPKLLMDTGAVPAGPQQLIWLAMYASLTERAGQRILWYTDRKHFVLGKHITDEALADMHAP